MNGSSRLPPGPLRRTAAQGSMRPPVRHGTGSSRHNSSVMSSPAPSISSRSRAETVSPSAPRRKAPLESPSKNNNEANINVVVRCRGRSDREKSENSAVVVSHPSTSEVALSLGPLATVENKIYSFDRTFGPEADQQKIYDNVVAPLLQEVGHRCGAPGGWMLTGDFDRCSMGIIAPFLPMGRQEPGKHTQ